MKLSKVNKALQALDHDGDIKAADVIEAAKKKSSPLHDKFEWDLKKAAYKDWTRTAEELINRYQIVVQSTTKEYSLPTHAYRHDPGKPSGTYTSTFKLKDNKERSAAVMNAGLARVRGQLEMMRRDAEFWGWPTRHLTAAMNSLDAFGALMEPIADAAE